MQKASKVMFIIGIVFAVLGLPFLVSSAIVSFSIYSPGYTDTLKEQIIDGRIVIDPSMTLDEQVAYIRNVFLIIGIISIVFLLILGASIVIANIAKRNTLVKFYVTNIVLGVLTLNTFLVLASIFALVAFYQEQNSETINVSY